MKRRNDPYFKEVKIEMHGTPVFYENESSYYSREYRRIINQGGTRSSKTYSICQLIALICLKERKSVSICSASLPHLKRSARRSMLEILQRMNVYKERNFNRTDNIYTFDNDSYIEFFGCENAGKMRGPGRDILFLTECDLVNYDVYKMLSLRTTETIFLDFNPASDDNWIYEEIKAPKTKLIVSNYTNNLENLTKEQVEEIEFLKETDPDYLWQIFGLGIYTKTSEKIYTHWKTIDWFPSECTDVFYGLDFGFVRPSALVKCGVKENKIFAELLLYQERLTTNELADKIIELGITGTIYCDNAEPDRITELARRGLKTLPADKDVKNGILKVKSMPLYITSNSADLIKEARAYKWKVDKDGKVLEEPVKHLDHALDALRYAVYTRCNKPKKKLVYSYIGDDVDKYGLPHSNNSSVFVNWN